MAQIFPSLNMVNVICAHATFHFLKGGCLIGVWLGFQLNTPDYILVSQMNWICLSTPPDLPSLSAPPHLSSPSLFSLWMETETISPTKWIQCTTIGTIIAELRQPKGPKRPPSGAPYSSGERKGNPRVDFLMVIMTNGIARGHLRQRQRRRSRAIWRPYSKKEVDRDIKPWYTV